MNEQNIFALFCDDPVAYNMKGLKAKLAITLVELIRRKGWSQKQAASELSVTQPRISNVFNGRLDKFSIDSLIEMLVRTGYKLEVSFDPENLQSPLSFELKRAML